MNKQMKSATFVSTLESMFSCPICGSSMHVEALKSLVCANNHTFDFAKQGYINLMVKQSKTKYDVQLFEERHHLIAGKGFFKPLIEAITDIVHQRNGQGSGTLSLLDAGCGEGSHLSAICDRISNGMDRPVMGAGIDIAKEGIHSAAKHYSDRIWSVADLAQIPFKDHQFDVILNILSPSNYTEFSRLLNKDGLVVKVVPNSGYLKELREAFFIDPKKQSYSNAETVARFREYFEIVDRTRVFYTQTLDHTSIQSLVHMTPLAWSATEASMASFLAKETAEITVDLEILVGREIVQE
jgi:23S rRNA (guanine745-N1)-methyltransferase